MLALALGAVVLAFGALAQTFKRDRLLEQSGFIMRPADTPQKLERLKLLPPLRFVRRTKPWRRYYLFADPNTTLADLFKPPLVANPFSTVWASLRRRSSEQFDDGVAHGW